jgi:hypothetical protein
MSRQIYIEKANYIDDYTVQLNFNDGVVRNIDFGYFLKTHPHPQHNKYLKYSNFRKFKVDSGNIVWGRNADLIFDTWDLYRGKNPR